MGLLDNIRYGNPNATMEDIYEACKVARIHDFIMQLEKKYDTEVSMYANNVYTSDTSVL